MSSSQGHKPITFSFTPDAKGRKGTIVVTVPGLAPFPDRVDPTSAKDRKRLQGVILQAFPCIDKGELESFLMSEGAKMVSAVAADKTGEPEHQRVSQSDEILTLAHSLYELGQSTEEEPFVVPKNGPRIVQMLREGKQSLKSKLAAAYSRSHGGRPPTSSAIGDAIQVLEGEAMNHKPTEVHLRVALLGGVDFYDLGDPSGKAVRISSKRWNVVPAPPVLFRRTELSSPAPVPIGGGSLDMLRELLNVSDETWPLLIGFITAALIPGIEHPIALLGGQHGTGKSTAARLLVSLIDPSPAPLISPPTNVEQWSVLARETWLVVVDNVSKIPEWWSDALCRAISGDGLVKRKLFSNRDLSVSSFRRTVMLTSIDTGAMRGDLGDRLVIIDLLPIARSSRLTESEIRNKFEKQLPEILGAVFTLLSQVLARLPHIELKTMSRMADFDRVLAAVDEVLGTQALPIFREQGHRIAEDVVDSSEVAIGIRRLAQKTEDGKEWSGTAGDLQVCLRPLRPSRDWPGSARGMSAEIRRCIPALAKLGVTVIPPSQKNRGSGRHRERTFRIFMATTEQTPTVRTVQPSANSSQVAPGLDQGGLSGAVPPASSGNTLSEGSGTASKRLPHQDVAPDESASFFPSEVEREEEQS